MYAERDSRPEPVEITETMVFVNTDIKEIEKDFNGEKHIAYSYNVESYTMKEYINYLQSQLSSTEMALCEIYEEVIS